MGFVVAAVVVFFRYSRFFCDRCYCLLAFLVRVVVIATSLSMSSLVAAVLPKIAA